MFLCVSALAVLSGCVVQSINTFYTDESRVPMPQIVGKWHPVSKEKANKDEKLPPEWIFAEDNVLTSDEKGIQSELETVYFKAGDSVFVDMSPGKLDDEKNKAVNGYWLMCTAPMHTVCKVEIKGNELKLVPANLKEILKMVETQKCELKTVKGNSKDSVEIFISSSAEWLKFLAKYANDKEVFDEQSALLFKLVKN